MTKYPAVAAAVSSKVGVMQSLKIVSVVLAGTLALIGANAHAARGDIRFFSGPYCAGDSGSGSWFDSAVAIRANCTYDLLCKNDFFRSVWIGTGVPYGTIIKVWDSPNGKHSDDWAQITVKTVQPNFYGRRNGLEGMCIDTFQSNRSGANYDSSYRRKNGLDGKVSLVKIRPA